MAKHDPQETITITREELSAMVAEAAAVAVKTAMALTSTPERKRVDAQAQVDEHLASLRPEADMSAVRTVACAAPNGAKFDAVQARSRDPRHPWRTVRLANYRVPDDLMERVPEGLLRKNPDGTLAPESKHWVAENYWISHLRRYVDLREPLPVDDEEMARRATAQSAAE